MMSAFVRWIREAFGDDGQPLLFEGTDDQEAFDERRRTLAFGQGRVACVVLLVATTFWWPLDNWVQPSDAGRMVFGDMRRAFGGLFGACLLALQFLGFVRRRILFLMPVMAMGGFFSAGYFLGQTGEFGLQWYSDALVVVVPLALMPLKRRARVVAMGLVCASLAAGFFLPHEGQRQHAMAPGQLSFTVFVWALTVAMGELFFWNFRRAFMQQRTIAAAGAAMEQLSASLAVRVEEQTNELRALAKHLDDALETERRRLSAELHDELGQDIMAMRLTLESMLRRVPEGPPGFSAHVDQLNELLGRATTSWRSVMNGLRPKILEELGFRAAMQALVDSVAASGRLRATLSIPDDVDSCMRGALALAAFRIAQEACTNVLKHSGASSVRLALRRHGDQVVVLEITDDGEGDPATFPTSGFGLLSMRERARAQGGTLTIEAAPQGGTVVRAVLPVAGQTLPVTVYSAGPARTRSSGAPASG